MDVAPSGSSLRDRRLEAAAGWLAVPHAGPVTIRRLLRRFPDPNRVLHVGPDGIREETALPIAVCRGLFQSLQQRAGAAELDRARRLGCRVRFQDDPGYPDAVRHAQAPPPVLYLLGAFDLPGPSDPVVAIVGTRRATPYGIEVAERLGEDLGHAGVVVVSGFARGIDSAAHRGCLDAPGRTVAVLGTGLDRTYPIENRRLAGRMRERGLLVSELPFDAAPLPEHFPRRNRILAALAQVVVVVEAGERSGALLTASIALDLGREVVAVPGPVTSAVSRGTQHLLRDGAAPVGDAQDVLELLESLGRLSPIVARARRSRILSHDDDGADGTAWADLPQRILRLLGEGPQRAEDVALRLGLDPATALALLGELELSGEVRRSPGARFARTGRGGRRQASRVRRE